MKRFDDIKGGAIDASGIDHPRSWFWERTNGIWYPTERVPAVQRVREILPLIRHLARKNGEPDMDLARELDELMDNLTHAEVMELVELEKGGKL